VLRSIAIGVSVVAKGLSYSAVFTPSQPQHHQSESPNTVSRTPDHHWKSQIQHNGIPASPTRASYRGTTTLVSRTQQSPPSPQPNTQRNNTHITNPSITKRRYQQHEHHQTQHHPSSSNNGSIQKSLSIPTMATPPRPTPLRLATKASTPAASSCAYHQQAVPDAGLQTLPAGQKEDHWG